MKQTLLTIVQDTLSACDAEEVSSVDETPEASMVVQIANRAFEYMITRYRWKHTRQVTALGAAAEFNQLVAPVGAYAIDPENIYYDGNLLRYMEPEEFIRYTIGRDASASNTVVIDSLKIYNDVNPTFFTSMDDLTLMFDAYPDSMSGLAPADSLAIMYVAPTTRLTTDLQYFNLPAVAFPALAKMALSIAMTELKGDSTAGRVYAKEFNNMMGNLAANGRFIDRPDDRRKWIVARRSNNYQVQPRIN